MIHPPSPHQDSRLSRRKPKGKTFTSRILSRLSFLVFGLMLLASWGGYQIASRNLSQSLGALPQFKAVSQAQEMSSTLENIRQKFIQLRDTTHEYTPEALREGLRFTFKGQEELIQEIGVKLPDSMGFMLFRDKGEFIELSHDIASAGSYAPFQQLLTFNLSLNKISLFPAVHYTPQGFANGATPSGEAVMRMTLPVDEETVLILGINFKAWSDKLIPSALQKEFGTQTDSEKSSAESSVSPENLQLAYYFDNAGWILAERSNQPNTEWHPNLARMGFGGDFGRQGYDAAFRPWAQHEKYWRMVTDIHEGRTGIIHESASGYSQDFKHTYGFLCYAPIVFSPNGISPPAPVGGIAFFESAPNIFASSWQTIGFYAVILFGAFLLFVAITLRFSRRLSRPFIASGNELKAMLEQRDLHYLQHDKASAEHTSLTSSVNTLITLTKGQSEQLDIMTATIQQTQATLPIDIDRNISSAILAGEFGLVGSSKAIAHVRENIHKAAQAGTDVLVWGETGTGKELVASAIHKASSRKNGPYISINCGALDENLLMDTLFGHVAGAFSDAVEDRKGAFLSASGGTLHLDELGNASPRVQQSLLRALSVRHIRPLGSDKEIPFDTRVIAATNADLLKAANEGKFRQDLYYRLAIINIHIPPLRKRKEDIPELAAFYIIESCRRLKKQTTYLSRGALKALTDHSWPGNVREFSNCLTRAVAYTEGDLILPEYIAFEPTSSMYGHDGSGMTSPAGSFWSKTSAKSIDASSLPADYIWPAPPRDNFSLTPEAQQAEDTRRSQCEPDNPHSTPATCPWDKPWDKPFKKPVKDSLPPHAGNRQNTPEAHWQASATSPSTSASPSVQGNSKDMNEADLAHNTMKNTPNNAQIRIGADSTGGSHAPADTPPAYQADYSPDDPASYQMDYQANDPNHYPKDYQKDYPTGHDHVNAQGLSAPSATPPPGFVSGAPQHPSSHSREHQSWSAPQGQPHHLEVPQSTLTDATTNNYQNNYQYKPSQNLVNDALRASIGMPNTHFTASGENGYGGTTLTPTVLLLYNQLLEKNEINERQMEALILSHSRKSFTRADYEKISGTNLSSRTIQNDLKDLLKLGLLIKTGNGPSTSYHKGDLPKLKTTTNQP